MAETVNHNKSPIYSVNTQLDRNSSVPLYHQLVTHFREEIRSRRIKPDQKFPTEIELAEAFNLSRHTTGKALAKLEQEGLLVRERGRGTFVRPFIDAANFNEGKIKYKRIGLVMPWDQAGFFSRLTVDIEHITHEHGYRVMVINNWDNPETELGRIREILDYGLDGLIWMCPQEGSHRTAVRQVLEKDIPIVAVDRIPNFEEGQVSVVEADNETGMSNMVTYLLRQGYRRFAMVSDGLPSMSSVRERKEGFEKTLSQAGIETSPDSFFSSRRRGIEAGRTCARRILRGDKDFDVICCLTDSSAVGVIQEFQEKGLRIPEDIAVTGFNDDELCTVIKPNITTVRIDVKQMGIESAQLLLDQLERKDRNEALSTVRITVPVTLVTRESA